MRTPRIRLRRALPLLTLLALLAAPAAIAGQPEGSADAAPERDAPRESPFVARRFQPFLGERWIGEAIAYGPHRDGQRPGGPSPTRDELREDLRLIAKRWNLLRIYGSVGPAENILDVIRSDRLPLKVMLGVWIEPEAVRDTTGAVVEPRPVAAAANRAEVETAIRLAAAYPDIVIAASVGNETQIFWSSHRVPAPLLTRYIRDVRARTTVPVTTADDFNFWNKPESRDLAWEIDFIVTHMHPLWNGLSVEDAPAWTARTYAAVQSMHPERTIVIGETGWATGKLLTGEQGTLMKAPAGEAEQAAFCKAFAAWTRSARVTTFFFEAFDENWKGSADSNDAEKHWGFYRADRTPKRVAASHE